MASGVRFQEAHHAENPAARARMNLRKYDQQNESAVQDAGALFVSASKTFEASPRLRFGSACLRAGPGIPHSHGLIPAC